MKIKPIPAAILLYGCTVGHPSIASTMPMEPCNGNAQTIATIGLAVLGAYIGNQIGDGKAAATLIGGAAGAWIGNYIGGEIDRRNCELKQIAQANNLQVSSDTIELKSRKDPTSTALPGNEQLSSGTPSPSGVIETSGKVEVTTWKGLDHFESGSDELTPQARSYFTSVANQYNATTAANAAIARREADLQREGKRMSDAEKKSAFNDLFSNYNSKPIVIVGHTDDTGDSFSNQGLSERRAKAVAAAFKSQGIPASRIYFRGAGAADPIGDNRTETGRSANRRVEVIELESMDRLESYIALKKPDIKYYRPKVATPDESVTTKSERTDAIVAPLEEKQGNKFENATLPPAATAQKVSSSIDFGGVPANKNADKEIMEAMGAPVEAKKSALVAFGSLFVKEAQATDEMVYRLPCTADVPHFDGQYLSLATGKEVGNKNPVRDFIPGLYRTTWFGSVNGNLVGITPVGILRNSFKSVTQPSMLVYANTEQPEKNAAPTMKASLQVNVYPGDKGLLYRVFPTNGKANSFVCADIVLPYHAPFTASAGKVYHKNGKGTYQSEFTPKMLTL